MSRKAQTGSNPLSGVISQKVSDILLKTAPVWVVLGNILNTVYPYVLQGYGLLLTFWVFLQPYHPEELSSVFFGLVLAFFGGHYFTLFAAIEAYRLCGYEQTVTHLKELYENYLKVKEANEKDNSRDDDNDGVPDVQQISSSDLLTRKISIVLEATDPVIVTKALSGIWMGFLGVVAVLRTKFAQTVALGATVGGIIESYFGEKVLKPILERAVPKTHHKWIPIVISYFCKVIGVSIAWTIQRVISAFYSSLKGANLFTAGLGFYLTKRGGSAAEFAKKISNEKNTSNIGYLVLTAVVAYLGFTWQISRGFSLPFPMNVVLFPLTLAEYFITWFVAVEN